MNHVNQRKGVRGRGIAYLLENKLTHQPTQCSTGTGLQATLAFSYKKAESDLTYAAQTLWQKQWYQTFNKSSVKMSQVCEYS